MDAGSGIQQVGVTSDKRGHATHLEGLTILGLVSAAAASTLLFSLLLFAMSLATVSAFMVSVAFAVMFSHFY